MTTGSDKLRKIIFKLVQKSLSGKGKFKINKQIRTKFFKLRENYGLERDEIHYAVISQIDKDIIEKYTGKYRLSTFALNVAFNGISNLLRYYEIRENNPEIRPCEQISINYQNPEKLLIGKELFEDTEKCFGFTDTRVLMGYDDRHSVAGEKNISYDTYCKQLLRKKIRFKSLIEKKGYRVN